ncbi:MAG TPA: hypothetical protein V6C99_02620 [Oculatellaceae cyanobacterium]|jgi:hypothetical protein
MINPPLSSTWNAVTNNPLANPSAASSQTMPLSAYTDSGIVPQSPQDRQIIQQALTVLGQIRHLPADEAYLYNYVGINPVFRNGAEALQLIQGRNIRVEFGDMGNSPAHAQWIADQNLIMINQRYRGDHSPDTIRAIAEAIYHEAGHAKDGDGESSIQEELDQLALNSLAHRYHEAQDPQYAENTSNSPLMSNGVALYPKLFFDPDFYKQALVNRVVTKYGDLPLTSPNHPVPNTLTGQKPVAQAVFEKASAPTSGTAATSSPNPALPGLPLVTPTFSPVGQQTPSPTGQRLAISG